MLCRALACSTALLLACGPDAMNTDDARTRVDASPRDTATPPTDTPAGFDAPPGTDAAPALDAARADAPPADAAPRDTGTPPRPDVSIIPPDAGPPDDPHTRSRDAMCARWLADGPARATTRWTPGPTACDPGTLDPVAHDDAMRSLNLYRWLSGVAAVGANPALADQQQRCAVMMQVNGMLSHTPPMSWMCYSAEGSRAAGSSNLALGGSSYPYSSVSQYINERGSSLGHRRWCLYPSLGPTWFGATSRASCMQVFARASGVTVPPYVAYPNPGFAPIENAMGHWSVQPGSRSTTGGTAQVFDETAMTTMPVAPFDASGGFGGGAATAWTPMGWTPQDGHTYRVTVTFPSAPMIQYRVTTVRCR